MAAMCQAVYNIVCMFGKLDSVTKMKLLKAYCCSFYGCELWDLSNIAVQTLCATWRKALLGYAVYVTYRLLVTLR